MVERRPALTVLSHLILILGVLIVAFPVYVAIIASTRERACSFLASRFARSAVSCLDIDATTSSGG